MWLTCYELIIQQIRSPTCLQLQRFGMGNSWPWYLLAPAWSSWMWVRPQVHEWAQKVVSLPEITNSMYGATPSFMDSCTCTQTLPHSVRIIKSNHHRSSEDALLIITTTCVSKSPVDAYENGNLAKECIMFTWMYMRMCMSLYMHAFYKVETHDDLSKTSDISQPVESTPPWAMSGCRFAQVEKIRICRCHSFGWCSQFTAPGESFMGRRRCSKVRFSKITEFHYKCETINTAYQRYTVV